MLTSDIYCVLQDVIALVDPEERDSVSATPRAAVRKYV